MIRSLANGHGRMTLAAAVLSVLTAGVISARQPDTVGLEDAGKGEETSRRAFAALPLLFEENVGQAPAEHAFISRGSRFTLGVSPQEATLILRTSPQIPTSPIVVPKPQATPARQAEVSMRLAGANAQAETRGERRIKGQVNYFLGNDPKKWHTDVPAFERVRTAGIYPGIDVVHYGRQSGELEYDFVVAPGSDPSRIRFGVVGAERVSLAENGDLVLATVAGEIRQQRPVCYQEKDGVRTLVDGGFVLTAANGPDPATVSFRLGSYNSAAELVIDPILQFSTYLGGSGLESATDIDAATDGSGKVYVTGNTLSTDFPTIAQLQTDQAGWDTFVTVFDTTASGPASFLYSTYLGGSQFELAPQIAADNSGKAYVCGWTNSIDYPTLGQIQGDPGDANNDGFVTVLDTTAVGAASLVYSTYLGGEGIDEAHGIATDGTGKAFVNGMTTSSDFPVLGAFQSAKGDDGFDAFVTVLDTTLSGAASLKYSTFLGGSSIDTGFGIATDGAGKAFVAGQTMSADFPVLGQIHALNGSHDMFVSVLDTTATGAASLVYSTYLGGSGGEQSQLNNISTMGGRAFVTGWTSSTDFPVVNGFQGDQPGEDAYVAVIDTTASGVPSLLYSTYLGGNQDDYGYGIVATGLGSCFVTGHTTSTDFPTLNEFQPDQPDQDAFVVMLKTSASGPASLLFSTYLGGDWLDVGSGIATDGAGKAYIAGGTLSLDFPLHNHFQSDPGDSNQDAWVTVFDLSALPRSLSGFTATPTALEAAPIHVAWVDEADNEQNIEIQKMAAGQMWTSQLFPPNTTVWDDTDIVHAVTYFYRGRTVNMDGVSPWSEIVSATAQAGIPNAPANLAVSVSMPGRLELAWTDQSSVEGGFQIDGKQGGGAFGPIGQTGPNITTFAHTGLNPNATWTYRVRAFVEMRASDPSNEASGTTLPAPPTVPGTLTARALSKGLVALSWADSTGETEYRLERKTGTKAFTNLAMLPAQRTSYFDTAVEEKTTYIYRIQAANTGGSSAFSNEATAKTPKSYSKGRLEVRPMQLDFKGVAPGKTATAKLTVRNVGKQPLKVVIAQPASPFALEGPVKFNLRPKQKKALKVRYTAPKNGKGAEAILSIADSGRVDPVVDVPLRGL